MLLGFTTGRPSAIPIKKRISIYKDLGCKAIELGLINAHQKERWDGIKSLKKEDLAGFEHISLHAPGLEFVYGKNDDTKRILEDLQEIHEELDFKHVT